LWPVILSIKKPSAVRILRQQIDSHADRENIDTATVFTTHRGPRNNLGQQVRRRKGKAGQRRKEQVSPPGSRQQDRPYPRSHGQERAVEAYRVHSGKLVRKQLPSGVLKTREILGVRRSSIFQSTTGTDPLQAGDKPRRDTLLGTVSGRSSSKTVSGSTRKLSVVFQLLRLHF